MASDWPRTFLQPDCFCLAYYLMWCFGAMLWDDFIHSVMLLLFNKGIGDGVTSEARALPLFVSSKVNQSSSENNRKPCY